MQPRCDQRAGSTSSREYVDSRRSQMFASLNRRRTVFAAALVTTLVAIPAIASAATGTSIHANVADGAGYCQPFGSTPSPSLGKAQIATTTATDPGFQAVNLNIRSAQASSRPARTTCGS